MSEQEIVTRWISNIASSMIDYVDARLNSNWKEATAAFGILKSTIKECDAAGLQVFDLKRLRDDAMKALEGLGWPSKELEMATLMFDMAADGQCGWVKGSATI